MLFIDVKTINEKKYYHTLKKSYSTNLETKSPFNNRILQQEQIELRKLSQLIQRHGGRVLDYSTDTINGTFKENNLKLPFELVEDIQLNRYHWDKYNFFINIRLNTIKTVSRRLECNKHKGQKHLMI
jgi:hypothetical protein